jgi:hypothetical protein
MTASIKQDVLYEYMQQESKYISQIDDLERVIEALNIDYNNFRELYFESEKEKIELLRLIKTLKDELGI